MPNPFSKFHLYKTESYARKTNHKENILSTLGKYFAIVDIIRTP
jgi:hypothetical protein